MLPFVRAHDLLKEVAKRAVARRLAAGLTRVELAARAGVAPDTLKLFEQTGKVSFERLLKVAWALGAEREFAALFPPIEADSLAALEQRSRGVTRKRGISKRRPKGGTSTEQP